MGPIKTVPNEERCGWMKETHELPVADCCPVSHNPQAGSVIRVSYEPNKLILEVADLRRYIDSYRGGKGEIRSMEGMIQAITQDAADSLGVEVIVLAQLIIEPGQRMTLQCCAYPPD